MGVKYLKLSFVLGDWVSTDVFYSFYKLISLKHESGHCFRKKLLR